MNRGYVYILTNKAMPGLVKIGRTTGDVFARAKALSSTGVPAPFNVYDFVETPDCIDLEQDMHDCFCTDRVNPDREFFSSDPADVSDMLRDLLQYQLERIVREYCPWKSVVDGRAALLIEEADNLCRRAWPNSDISLSSLARLLRDVTARDLRGAVERHVNESFRAAYNGPLLPQVGWNGPQSLEAA